MAFHFWPLSGALATAQLLGQPFEVRPPTPHTCLRYPTSHTLHPPPTPYTLNPQNLNPAPFEILSRSCELRSPSSPGMSATKSSCSSSHLTFQTRTSKISSPIPFPKTYPKIGNRNPCPEGAPETESLGPKRRWRRRISTSRPLRFQTLHPASNTLHPAPCTPEPFTLRGHPWKPRDTRTKFGDRTVFATAQPLIQPFEVHPTPSA